MSVDWLFLIPVPPAVLASDAYLDVDDFWKGDDYLIECGDRWDPRLERSKARRRQLAVELTQAHVAALRGVKSPREIIVTTDAAAPDERGKTYAEVRAQWLASGAIALPDVVEEVVARLDAARAVPPLQPSDVRIPFPEGTLRARLRRLDPAFALAQLRGSRRVSVAEAAGVRAGVVLIDVEHADLDLLRGHYRAALHALGMAIREDKPSKWIEMKFVQMRGRAGNIEVSITAKPTARAGIEVGVLWVERVVTDAPDAPQPPSKRKKS